MDLQVNGKKVLVRVDFNVPLNAENKITDDTRMRKALPTINYLIENKAAVILMSHLGRPQKKRKEDGSLNIDKFTLRHLVAHLSTLLEIPVKFAKDLIGPDAIQKCKDLMPGEVLLLENTRFEKGEELGDAQLAQEIAALGDCYVNDAFGTAHRAHASTALIAQYFSSDNKSFGFLMDAEINNANRVLNNPARPLTAIVGGAKVSDKILLLSRLIEFVDNLIVGGGMAYTFVKAKGGQTGKSLVEEDKLGLALELIEKAKQRDVALLLPDDSIVANAFAKDAEKSLCQSDEIDSDWMGLDIGPSAIEKFGDVILDSKTILWNGPMGVFEMEPFATGTRSIAQAIADATKQGAFSLVGGGDSVAAVTQMGLSDEVSYMSTGGGAMLEYLEGKELPGIKAMR